MPVVTGHEQRRLGVQAAVQKIADRHETLTAPGLQLRDDARQVLHRGVHRIMEEEDAAQVVIGVALAPRVDQGGIIFAHAPPVLAVQRPEHDLEIHLLGGLQRDVVERTVRRTQETGLDAQGAQKALHPADLLALGRQVEMAQIGMGIGMDADLVAFVMDALHEIRPALGIPSQHEESGRDIVRGQDVEDLRRIGRRAVIETQGAEVLLHGLRDDAHPIIDPALARTGIIYQRRQGGRFQRAGERPGDRDMQRRTGIRDSLGTARHQQQGRQQQPHAHARRETRITIFAGHGPAALPETGKHHLFHPELKCFST